MTTPNLQAMIDDAARSIAAFNGGEYAWQDCPEDSDHRKGHLCIHQVRALARHLVANKHPVQGEQGHIEAAKLTDEEILAIPREWDGGYAWRPRDVADAATAKALAFQDARHKTLVAALRTITALAHRHTGNCIGFVQLLEAEGPDTIRDAQAALKGEA